MSEPNEAPLGNESLPWFNAQNIPIAGAEMPALRLSYAGELGREVFAIPGSIHNPLARGCHQLIRQGAKLVEQASDVLIELAPALRAALDRADEQPPEPASTPRKDPQNAPETPRELTPEYARLLDSVGFDPTELSEIVVRSTLTTAEVSSMLLLLELEGHVEALPGGRYTRIT